MKRVILLCLVLLFGKMSAESATTFFPPLQPMQTPSGIQNYNSNATENMIAPFGNNPNQNYTNYANLERVETTLFGQSYVNQSLATRLSRIEKSLFTTTYPNSSNEQRIDNIISNFNQINKYPNISRSELSNIESKILRHSYPQNNAELRIERLEQQIFGAVQSGDIEARFETLKTAATSYNKNSTYENQTTPRGWKGIASALGNSMLGGTMCGGSMTGFTPQIDPFFDNNNNWGNSNNNNYPSGSGMYRGYRSNHGYMDNYQNFSSGSGVTILD